MADHLELTVRFPDGSTETHCYGRRSLPWEWAVAFYALDQSLIPPVARWQILRWCYYRGEAEGLAANIRKQYDPMHEPPIAVLPVERKDVL